MENAPNSVESPEHYIGAGPGKVPGAVGAMRADGQGIRAFGRPAGPGNLGRPAPVPVYSPRPLSRGRRRPVRDADGHGQVLRDGRRRGARAASPRAPSSTSGTRCTSPTARRAGARAARPDTRTGSSRRRTSSGTRASSSFRARASPTSTSARPNRSSSWTRRSSSSDEPRGMRAAAEPIVWFYGISTKLDKIK